MAEGTVQLPPDSTGKKLRTLELTVGANTVEQEVVSLSGPEGGLLGAASVVQINYDPTSGGDTVVYKPRYLCVAPPGTALTAALWTVQQLTWSRIAANVYKRTSVRVQTTSLLTSGSDTDPWNTVTTRLNALSWSL